MVDGLSAERRAELIRIAVDMIPVSSSNIYAVGYDEENNQLQVQFKTKDGGPGAMYRYFNVAKEVYDGMLNAASVGSFFHYNVKSAGYDYEVMS